MKTLEEIGKFAEKHNACEAQINKCKQLFEEGNELMIWQTVLGNIRWLKYKGLDIDILEVEKKAKGVGVGWYENGQKKYEINFKNGKEKGKWIWWYENGHKKYEENYKNGKEDGKWIWWYENGQKKYEGNYKNGKLISKKHY